MIWKSKGWVGCYFEHAHDDLNLLILRMFEGTFSLDVVHCKCTCHVNAKIACLLV